METFSIDEIRGVFPTLKRKVNLKQLVYFDNGATSQKPQVVIDRINHFYTNENANIHRGVHQLSQEATTAYEDARMKIQNFIGAQKAKEVIFTKGTTDGINLVAFSLGETLSSDDNILISAMEHHSNIVPWQMLCERKGCELRIIPMNQKGELELDKLDILIDSKTKLVAVSHVSNTLGTVNDIRKIIALSHQKGAKVLIDGAQSIQHLKIDVKQLDCDFFVFSGHKVFGPTGVGILYGKESILNELPPYQGGGDMIKEVTLKKTTYNELPHKFEAGTPNIIGGIGLGTAIEYLEHLNWMHLNAHEQALLEYATSQLKLIDGIKIYGESDHKISVISFLVDEIHPLDIGTILDKMGIAVRTGHHCTQPIMDFYGIPGTIRISFAFYNTKEEIDLFITALKRAISMLK